MKAEIKNIYPALSADSQALGLAVKALIAGGSALGPAGIRRASGASAYVWSRKGDDIVRLVQDMEEAAGPLNG